jgi:acetyl esterase/lipase
VTSFATPAAHAAGCAKARIAFCRPGNTLADLMLPRPALLFHTALPALAAIAFGLAPLAARAAASTLLTRAVPPPTGNGLGAGNNQTDLYIFAPAEGNGTGAAVLIAASSPLSEDGAGFARWLAERGVTGFVLRGPAQGKTTPDVVAHIVQHLRAHAAEFKIAPNRIGLLGLGDSGGALAADAGYNKVLAANPDASDPVERVSSRPDFMALVWGSAPVAPETTGPLPPTFLVGSANAADGQSGMIDLWARLRGAGGGGRGGRGGAGPAPGGARGGRGGGGATPVDAHFFAKAPADSGLGAGNPSLSEWPETFLTWVKYMGFLTDGPRVPLRGTVLVDGRTLPHGYLILTPVDFVGAGPIAAQILNSTANVPMGQFSVPANLGAVPGRYRVDVRQNMTRWISNSFTGNLAPMRANNEEQAWFGHHRPLAPSVADLSSFTKVRPGDKDDYIIEIKPGADANLDLKLEVFSSDTPPPTITITDADAALAGFSNPPANPGQLAYVEQLKAHPPGKIPGIPEPVLLWPEGAPGAIPDSTGAFADEDKPALYPLRAPAATNTGAAFLVIPGGAFTNRGMDNEGVQIAQFLNRNGIAGFVLRYRIGPNYPSRATSTMDGQRAMRWIRAHAAEYGVNPERIGIIGFSAGAELEGDAFYNAPVAGNPDAADPVDRLSAHANFSALIYGGRNITAEVAAVAPPTFLFNTLEDAGHLTPELSVFNAMRAAGRPVEAHWYQNGPHGTSMSLGDPQLGQWPGLMVKWLKTAGWLDAQPAAK